MPIPSRDDRRSLLAADCANCFGLCCVALSFARSADFAFDKPAGEPCANLQTDFACGIHERLRPSGFRGCTVFDCSGAGQKVSRDMYGGVSWRDDPAVRAEMFAVFPVVRDLHELLWYLAEASELSVDAALRDEVAAAFASTRDLTDLAPGDLLSRDIEPLRSRVGEMLGRVSEQVRGQLTPPWTPSAVTRKVGPRADLMGARFAGRDLRGANLRGSLLIAADLRGTDLTGTDLLGVDLRDAVLDGAQLDGALFVTQRQLNSARGSSATVLPAWVDRPSHWG
ncbi:pentapeptide repeat-containing protein [Okibacterium fritillariae]|uniref:pentapeptide repeat-containing protein n=1 Tax=Okibacterium fritillariae TaxID=123320 RepID=UPI0040557107